MNFNDEFVWDCTGFSIEKKYVPLKEILFAYSKRIKGREKLINFSREIGTLISYPKYSIFTFDKAFKDFDYMVWRGFPVHDYTVKGLSSIAWTFMN